MSRILILLLCCLTLGCTKEQIHTVSGNQAPPDSSVDQLQVDNYINRIYIGLLGRKASDTEFGIARALFETNPASKAAREQLIQEVQNQPEWRYNLVFRAKLNLIEGVDSATMARDYSLIIMQLNDTAYQFIKPLLEIEKNRLEVLIDAEKEFMAGNIDLVRLHEICVDNLYYDQINMGTENFVVSLFQHFLDRYPSSQELNNGKTMVDGANSSIFLETGSGKGDFIDIFFGSEAYCEGQVHFLYQSFLFRKATQDEILILAAAYRATHDFAGLQKTILSTDEYFMQ